MGTGQQWFRDQEEEEYEKKVRDKNAIKAEKIRKKLNDLADEELIDFFVKMYDIVYEVDSNVQAPRKVFKKLDILMKMLEPYQQSTY